MDLVEIYKCLADRTRLRILNLLSQGALCVCHFQTILDEPQVKVSKHLRYLRDHGLVSAARSGNWIVYRLAAKPSKLLTANLQCLNEDTSLKKDLARLRQTDTSNAVCC